MNELNIYRNFNYRELRKLANIYFNGHYKWYNARTVFASQKAQYTVSINKNNIRICYCDGQSEQEKSVKEILRKFLLLVFHNESIDVIYTDNCDILEGIISANKIQVKRG